MLAMFTKQLVFDEKNQNSMFNNCLSKRFTGTRLCLSKERKTKRIRGRTTIAITKLLMDDLL